VSELGVNVLDVEHSRISGSLALGEVDIALALETRGLRHSEEVTAALQKAGYLVV
jgi:threonine dehydratase